MATRLEILSADGTEARVALYYAVPGGSQLPGAVDANRVAAGTRLSAGELQALKDGTLFEFIRTVPINAMTTAQARTRVENLWAETQAQALVEYNARFRFPHLAWDGTNWS